MDLSKLPRLSQTTTPPNEAGPDVPVPPEAGFAVGPTSAAAPNASSPTSSAIWCTRCHAPNAVSSTYCNNCGEAIRSNSGAHHIDPGVGAEVWVAAIVGIVVMLMGLNFARWSIATLTGNPYHTNSTWQIGERAGEEVKYWDLQGYAAFQDMSLFLFGLAMMLEAIVLTIVHSRIKAKRPLLAFAIILTLAATIMNLVLSAKLFSIQVTPIMSLLCVGFGGYIVAYEWRLFQHFSRAAQRA
jgi:hypothetical protein